MNEVTEARRLQTAIKNRRRAEDVMAQHEMDDKEVVEAAQNVAFARSVVAEALENIEVPS